MCQINTPITWFEGNSLYYEYQYNEIYTRILTTPESIQKNLLPKLVLPGINPDLLTGPHQISYITNNNHLKPNIIIIIRTACIIRSVCHTECPMD